MPIKPVRTKSVKAQKHISLLPNPWEQYTDGKSKFHKPMKGITVNYT